MEMAEEKKLNELTLNLLNVNIQEITDLPKQMFETKVNNLAEENTGNSDHQRISNSLCTCRTFQITS